MKKINRDTQENPIKSATRCSAVMKVLMLVMVFVSCDKNEVSVEDPTELINSTADKLELFIQSVFYKKAVALGYEIGKTPLNDEKSYNDGDGMFLEFDVKTSVIKERTDITEKLVVAFNEDGKLVNSFISRWDNNLDKKQTGSFGLEFYAESTEKFTLDFEDGVVMTDLENTELQARTLGCRGPRSVGVCVGYKIERMGFWESVAFFSTFGASMIYSSLDCLERGCPYYEQDIE